MMNSSPRPLHAILAVIVLLAPGLVAQTSTLKLPSFFSNGMVLQRDKPLKIWGWSTPESEVTLSFGNQKTSTKASDGKWTITLQPQPANSKAQAMTLTSGSESLTLNDILIGDVWICGGQSNMEWRLGGTSNADLEIPSARSPQIRFYRIEPEGLPEPRTDIPVKSDAGLWRTCTPDSVADCSGVAYHFAKRLHQYLDVPIGLINAAWGGTMAQHWVTRETLDTLPTMKDTIAKYEEDRRKWIAEGGEEGAGKRFADDLKSWEALSAAAEKEGRKLPPKPNRNSYQDPALGRIPAGPLNAMIMPLAGLPVRGVLFYQGENNSFGETWIPFQETFPAVINDWRKLFQDDSLPFGIIQIAGWSTRRSMTYDMNHHTNVVREIQFNTWQSTPNTGLIVSFDANSDDNIHPRRKAPVGERSARWALSRVYQATHQGSPLDWHGPVYHAMEKSGEKIKVTFKKTGADGLRLDKSDARGFYLAGADQVFHHAEARVISNRGDAPAIEVWSPQVPDPVAVRYAFSNLPLGSLMNGRELPAFPFRTDDWPLQPHHGSAIYRVSK